MFLPYGTDAPSPRAPIGTYSLIAANVILFALQDVVVPKSVYKLAHDGWINPLQWIWSAFAHADPCHLLGNMIFLFVFGSAVESAMRTRRFIVTYLATAVIQCAAEQIGLAMLGFGGCGSLGASSAIYGTMVIGILCVPGCNIKCLLTWFYVRWITFEVPLMIFAAFYVFWDIGAVLFGGLGFNTPMLHAMGAFTGLAVGIVVYRMGWCESDGNDLVSLIKEAWCGPKIDRRTPREILADKAKEKAKSRLPQKIAALDQHLKQGGLHKALDCITEIRRDSKGFRPSEKQVIRLINVATRKKEWDHALVWIEDYLKRFKAIENIVRLQKARLLVIAFESPTQSLRELRLIDRRTLNLQHQKLFRQLVAKSNQLRAEMQTDGEYEIRLPETERKSHPTRILKMESDTEIPPEFWLRQK